MKRLLLSDSRRDRLLVVSGVGRAAPSEHCNVLRRCAAHHRRRKRPDRGLGIRHRGWPHHQRRQEGRDQTAGRRSVRRSLGQDRHACARRRAQPSRLYGRQTQHHCRRELHARESRRPSQSLRVRRSRGVVSLGVDRGRIAYQVRDEFRDAGRAKRRAVPHRGRGHCRCRTPDQACDEAGRLRT